MMPTFERATELFLRQTWQIAVVATVCGCIASLVRPRRPHLAYALWALVLVKALTPPVWNSPMSLLGRVELFWRTAEVTGPAELLRDERTESRLSVADATKRHAWPTAESTQSMDAATVPHAMDRIWPLTESVIQWMFRAWWIGVLLHIGWVATVFVRTWLTLRRPVAAASQALTELAANVAGRLGLRRVPEVVLAESLGPAVCDVLRPRVILPASLVAETPRDRLTTILAHELIHVRRCDLWMALLQTIARCVWWFHPLVWWASRSMSRERERCCDLEVVASGIAPREAYAQCLIDTLQLRSRISGELVPVGLTAFQLTHARLKEIMKVEVAGWKSRRRVALVMAFVAAIVVLPGSVVLRTSGLEVDGANAEGRATDSVQNSHATSDAPASENPAAVPGSGKENEADEPAWKKQFRKTYGLREGELVRRVPPPFAVYRAEYFRDTFRRADTELSADEAAKDYLDHFTRFVWRDGWPDSRVIMSVVSVKPEVGVQLGQLLHMITGFRPARTKSPDALLTRQVTGDFIVQADAAPEKVATALEKILRKDCGLAVALKVQVEERKVYVLSGRYEAHPLPERKNNEIEVYATHLGSRNWGGGGGSGTLSEFADHVEGFIESPIVLEGITGAPKVVEFHFNYRSPFTKLEAEEDHDPDAVTANIAKQTGLTVKYEKREIRILVVEESQ